MFIFCAILHYYPHFVSTFISTSTDTSSPLLSSLSLCLALFFYSSFDLNPFLYHHSLFLSSLKLSLLSPLFTLFLLYICLFLYPLQSLLMFSLFLCFPLFFSLLFSSLLSSPLPHYHLSLTLLDLYFFLPLSHFFITTSLCFHSHLFQAGEDIANALWVAANTKKCPRCTTAIEKDEGCNHMSCRKCRCVCVLVCSCVCCD